MKTAFLAILMLFQATAFAEQCQGITELVQQTEMSFAGVEARTPRGAASDRTQWTNHDVLFIKLPERLGVMDAFHHVVWVNLNLSQAWIIQSGGIIGTSEFYGPYNVNKEKFENCVSN
jgi:hypothetical protein